MEPLRRSRTRRCLGVRALVVGSCVVGAISPTLAAASPSQTSDGVARATDALKAAQRSRVDADAHLATLESELAALGAQLDRRFADASELAADLEDARRQMRASAVTAYVNGGDHDPTIDLLAGVDLAEASGRVTFAAGRTMDWADALDRFQGLKADNDPQLVALVERREALASRVADARDAAYQAAATEADAERASAAATEKAARDAAARAEAERVTAEQRATANSSAARRGSSGGSPAAAAPRTASAPTPSGAIVVLTELSAPLPELPPGGPSEEAWAAVRRCESGGNYRAVSSSGRYRGAYQFDQQTWEAMGGRGDPAGALPLEQDARAKRLYAERGARAWPQCGRALVA